jgi:hypothetical protein
VGRFVDLVSDKVRTRQHNGQEISEQKPAEPLTGIGLVSLQASCPRSMAGRCFRNQPTITGSNDSTQ